MTTPRPSSTPSSSPYGAPTSVGSRIPSADPGVWVVRVAAGIIALGGFALLVPGVWLIDQDAAQQGEMFDGLGVVIGLVVVGVAGVVLGVAAFTFWLAPRHPFGTASVVCGFGLLVMFGGWLFLGSGEVVAATLVILGLLVSGLGFGAAVALRR